MKQFIDLLPYDFGALIRNHQFELRVLQLSQFILTLVRDSISAFHQEQNLMKFDAHVGESSCQIRALFLNDFRKSFTPKLSTDFIQNQLNKIQVRLALIDTEQYKRNFNKKFETLKDYLDTLGITFELSNELYILSMCYFLTKYRVSDQHENIIINYNRLDTSFPKNIFRRIVHYYQVAVSDFSVSYLKQFASQCIDMEAFNLLCQKDDDNRSVMPCVLSNQIIMQRLKQSKTSILFVIRLKNKSLHCMFYQYNEAIDSYFHQRDPSPSQLQEYCYIMHAITEYERYEEVEAACEKRDTETLISGLMHVHPQYSGVKLRALAEDPYWILLMSSDRKFADKISILRSYFHKQVLSIQQDGDICNKLIIRHIFVGIAEKQYNFANNDCFYIDQIIQIWLNSLNTSDRVLM
jgi:hypothetical protein